MDVLGGIMEYLSLLTESQIVGVGSVMEGQPLVPLSAGSRISQLRHDLIFSSIVNGRKHSFFNSDKCKRRTLAIA